MAISSSSRGLRPGVCTSTTRPENPFDGQVIYMTDVDQTAVWDSSQWTVLAPIAGGRNVIINGAMQVAQRGTSVAGITSSAYYTVDRFSTTVTTQGTWTQSVENDAPTGSGLRKSLKMLCTTADSAPAAGDRVMVHQYFEGQNLQQFLKGTASAKQFSVSFWVKSNVTGTYVVAMYDSDNNRSVSASYTISVSGTWEKKTITFPADTTGAFDNDNANSLGLEFSLGAGSNFTSGTLGTTWASYNGVNYLVGQVNVAAAINNAWQITGVQLEAGAVATPFEFEDFGVTLAKCQRYYFLLVSGTAKSFGVGAMITATEMQTHVYFPTTMRTTPTLVAASGANYYDFVRNGGDDLFNSLTIVQASSTGAGVGNATEISGTAGHAGRLLIDSASGSIAFSAEL